MSNELLYNQLYERTKDFGRSQFVREIMRLERENNQLKEQRQELRSWLEEEIKEEYRLYKEFLRIGVIKGETKLTSQFKRVLSKLNELEGKNE